MARKKDSINKSKQELSNKKDIKAAPKQNLREKFTELLELPKEIVLDMPKLTMLGNGDLIIENYKGIVEYDANVVRVNTTSGIIKVMGIDVYIKEITAENIMIYGNILSLEFQK
jgi:sporulation protein YqfC